MGRIGFANCASHLEQNVIKGAAIQGGKTSGEI
jgi:hypothetical protein